MSKSDDFQTSELEQIVREVIRGERFIIIPPGGLFFVLTNMLMVVALPALVLPILGWLLHQQDPGFRVPAQLMALGVMVPLLVAPGILLILGHIIGRSMLRLMAMVIIAIGIAVCLSAWLNLSPIGWRWPAIAVTAATCAYLLLSTARYELFTRFFALRAAMLRQKR